MIPSDIILQLEATTKRTEKEAIIQAAWDSNCTEFFEGARLAYDSLITFGIKKAPLIEGEDDADFTPSLTWGKFRGVLDKLSKRELTGNTAREVLRAAANNAAAVEWNAWYRRILLKDLKCGITETTINKILQKSGGAALDYVIPVFSCQLAKNGDDHAAKIAGRKLLDPKLDGVRIITILNKDNNTVTQYSRDGRLNDRFETITSSLAKLLPMLKQSVVLDGEMISRNFQDLMKQLNRKNDVDTSDAKLALFDVVPLSDFVAGECNLPQITRHEVLTGLMPLLEQHCGNAVYVIPKMMVDLDTEIGQQQFKEFNKDTLDAGYEGILLKDPNAPYECKRTVSWLKIKPIISVDLKIVNLQEGTGKNIGILGALVCEGLDGDRFIKVNVGSGLSDEQRINFWKHKDALIGQTVEILADAITKAQNSENEYSLRFPRFNRFRDDK